MTACMNENTHEEITGMHAHLGGSSTITPPCMNANMHEEITGMHNNFIGDIKVAVITAACMHEEIMDT